MKNNHINLISNVGFQKLPEWFKKSKTENAEITYENGILIWKSGTWKSGVWEKGFWEDGIWKCGIWKSGIWKNGTWENGTWKNGNWGNGTWKNGIWKKGIWENGTWKNGNWENGFKKVGFCKWNVFYNLNEKTIKIGCKENSINGWENFFNSDKIYQTERNNEEFENIYKSFLLAKFAIENNI